MEKKYTLTGRVIILISVPFLVLGSSRLFVSQEVDAFCIIGSIVFAVGLMSLLIGWTVGD